MRLSCLAQVKLESGVGSRSHPGVQTVHWVILMHWSNVIQWKTWLDQQSVCVDVSSTDFVTWADGRNCNFDMTFPIVTENSMMQKLSSFSSARAVCRKTDDH